MPQANAHANRPAAVTSRIDQPNSIRRSVADNISSTSGPVIQRLHGGYGGETHLGSGTAVTDENFPQMLRNNFDLLIELLEDRIISDIERRGGRYRGDF